MSIKRLLRIAAVCCLTGMLLCAAARVYGAENTTVFMLSVEQGKDGAYTIKVLTDKTEGVGGLFLRLRYPAGAWRADGDSMNTGIADADLNWDSEKGEIVFLWDVAGEVSLERELFSVNMERLGGNISDLKLTVEEYYDNTVAMNNLAYTVTAGDSPDGGGQWWVWVVIAAATIAAAALVFLIRRRAIQKLRG